MTVKIPDEYIAFDYGFSGVDAPPEPTVVQPPAPTLSDDRLAQLEAKIEQLLQNSGAQGTEDELKQDIRTLEGIIVPLLNNLLKTADRDYIYWPNRREVIEKQLEKVLEITRG